MWNAFRKIGIILFVLMISAGIYLVFYAEKEVREDVLEYSLNLMGDKLFAMVPEGPEKTKLNELYNDFKQRAVEGEVAPEQIEHVAANILNVSNSDSTLTPQQAEVVLLSALMAPKPPIPPIPQVLPVPEEPAVPEVPHEVERWEGLGERIKTMFEFNENMRRTMKEHAIKHRELARQIHYQVKDGLQLALDARLRARFKGREFRRLARELRHLEKERLLEFRQNLAEELEKEMEEVHKELESLHESLEELKKEQAYEALKSLESLKRLEHLKDMSVVDPDSIRKVVEESLREAGIHPREREK